jgi:hypothetical protein
MSLKAKIQKQVQSALQKIDDLALSITYVSVVPGTYDPATDTNGNTDTPYPGIKAAIVRMTEEERAVWPVNKQVEKILIAALDLPGVSPKMTDYVLIDGDRWEVKKLTPPPGDALHILFVARP